MSTTTILQAAMLDLFADAGASATFTPAAGDTVDCTVLVDRAVQMQPAGYEARTWETGTVLQYLYAVVGSEANRGETFTVDGTVYTVAGILENDGIVVKCEVKV